MFFDDAELDVHVYQLNEDGAAEELADSEEDIAACQTYTLPAVGRTPDIGFGVERLLQSEFEGVWESLVYEDDTKRRLLNYARTAMLFSDRNVDANLIAWNRCAVSDVTTTSCSTHNCRRRIILLFGPPGTGKTSLCKGIAQKLSIRLSRRYQHAQFVEINAHSLFSKWFSESGKLVLKLFQRINDLVDDDSSLVFVLIGMFLARPCAPVSRVCPQTRSRASRPPDTRRCRARNHRTPSAYAPLPSAAPPRL